MLQLICSDCSSELDIDAVQHGNSIELRVSRCSCQDFRIDDLEDANYNLSKELEEFKSQVEFLTRQLISLESKS